MYFSDENTLNKLDRNLKKLINNNNLQSLFAVNTEKYKYEFNIHLQGAKETIFFKIVARHAKPVLKSIFNVMNRKRWRDLPLL